MANYKERKLLAEIELEPSPKGSIPIIKIHYKKWLDDSECIQLMKFVKETGKTWYPMQYLQIPLAEKDKFIQLVAEIRGRDANDTLPSPHECGGFPTQPAQLKTIPQRGDRY